MGKVLPETEMEKIKREAAQLELDELKRQLKEDAEWRDAQKDKEAEEALKEGNSWYKSAKEWFSELGGEGDQADQATQLAREAIAEAKPGPVQEALAPVQNERKILPGKGAQAIKKYLSNIDWSPPKREPGRPVAPIDKRLPDSRLMRALVGEEADLDSSILDLLISPAGSAPVLEGGGLGDYPPPEGMKYNPRNREWRSKNFVERTPTPSWGEQNPNKAALIKFLQMMDPYDFNRPPDGYGGWDR
jgi:hypothetical protein